MPIDDLSRSPSRCIDSRLVEEVKNVLCLDSLPRRYSKESIRWLDGLAP